MTIRTLQFYGVGQMTVPDVTPGVVTVKINGTTIFTGPVTTLNRDVDVSTDLIPYCDYDVDVNYSGTVSVEISVVNAGFYVNSYLANYSPTSNPVFTAEELAVINNPSSLWADKVSIWQAKATPALSSSELATLSNPPTPPGSGQSVEQQAIIASHGITSAISSGPGDYELVSDADVKSNVVINGVAESRTGTNGQWIWFLPENGTMTFDLAIPAGLE